MKGVEVVNVYVKRFFNLPPLSIIFAASLTGVKNQFTENNMT